MLLLSSIFSQFAQRKKDLSDVGDVLFCGWMTTIADFLYDMKRDIDPEQFIATQTYTVSSSPQTSPLPSNFLGMQELGTGVYLVGPDGRNTDLELPMTGFGSSQIGYYLDGDDNIIFTGMDSGQQYRLRYMPLSPTFCSLSEYFSFDKTSTGKKLMPDSKIEYLINALDVLYSRWDEDISSEVSADQRFIRELDRLLAKDRRNPNAIALPDFTANF